MDALRVLFKKVICGLALTAGVAALFLVCSGVAPVCSRVAHADAIANAVTGRDTDATAKNSDNEVRTLLIDKLTHVYLTLPSAEPSRLNLGLRIADLLSERARAESQAEMAKGCSLCDAGKEDRVKALRYYKEALPQLGVEMMGRVMTQIGHLYELVGNENGALQAYNKILNESKDAAIVSEARLSLGEFYFKKNKYSEAKLNYEKVLSSGAKGAKGLAAYRLAWCEFRLGAVAEAAAMAQNILKTPELLTRSSALEATTKDVQFQEEVARDLVTFMAQMKGAAAEARIIYDLSPPSAKLNHVFAFAVELDRLGMKSNSMSVWRFLQEKENRPLQRLEGYVRLAQIEMEQKLKKESTDDYERALNLWPDVCHESQEATCRELSLRIKNFIIDWNKLEAANPSLELFAAYEAYLKVFPHESEINIQAGVVAKAQKNWPLAIAYFNKAVQDWTQPATSGEKTSREAVSSEKVEPLEPALLNIIEIAELSKDKTLIQQSLEEYLAKSKKRSAFAKVQYQRARLIYDQGNYRQAAELFREIAKAKTGDLREKAADLSLDALVLLKDDIRLEQWSREYAGLFASKAREYLAIANKSVLNQAVHLAPESSEKALARLNEIDVSAVSDEEKAAAYKNRVLISEKLHKFDESRRATNELLALKSLSPADHDFALEHKAYLAELTLDFNTALAVSKELPEKNGENKWLKLALFAELAQQEPRPYYIKFIANTKDDEKAKAVAVKLVKNSLNDLKEIQNYKAQFKNDPELLASLYLEAYAKNRQPEIIKIVTSDSKLKGTFAYKSLLRLGLLSEFAKIKSKLIDHKIETQTQKKLTRSLKTRAKFLTELEALAKKAVDLDDFSSQLVILDTLGKQNQRFYDEVLSLPMPDGLSPEEQGQYLQLLSQQVAANQTRAKDLAAKVNEFWQNKKAIDDIQAIYPKQSPEVRELLKPEVNGLAEIAPNGVKAILAGLWDETKTIGSGPKVDFKVIEQARSDLRQDPLNPLKIKNLINLEKDFGDSPMVSYLESRLANIEGAK